MSQQPLKQVKPKVYVSAICWSISSDLYVGSKEGFLLCVNPETLIVSVLYKPQSNGLNIGKGNINSFCSILQIDSTHYFVANIF